MRCLSLVLLLVLASSNHASAQVRPPWGLIHKRGLQQAPISTGQPTPQAVAIPVIPVQPGPAPPQQTQTVTQLPPEVANAVNAAVAAANAAVTAANQALSAAQTAQQAVTNAANQQPPPTTGAAAGTTAFQQPTIPTVAVAPAPEIEAGAAPIVTQPQIPPVAATGTFAAPGNAPLAEPVGVTGANQTELAVNAGKTGVPAQNIPGGLPSRLSQSLAAQQPYQG